jgi:hypothetical protein
MPYRLPHLATTLNYMTEGNYEPWPVAWLKPGRFNELGSQNSPPASPCGCRKHRLPVLTLDRVSRHGTKEYYFSYHVRHNKCTVFKSRVVLTRCASSPDFSERGAPGQAFRPQPLAIDSRFSPFRTFHHPGWQVLLKGTEPLSAIGGHRSAGSSVNKSGQRSPSLPPNLHTDSPLAGQFLTLTFAIY